MAAKRRAKREREDDEDVNLIAHRILQQATGEAPSEPKPAPKRKAAAKRVTRARHGKR